MKAKKNNFKLYILAVIALLIASGIFLTFFIKNNKDVVAEVNEIPIYIEEITIAAGNLRLNVRNEWMNTYELESDKFSWDEVYKGNQSALDYVTDKAVTEIAGNKLLQKVAQEMGIIEEIDYPFIEKQMGSENLQRQEKKSKNEVFYGITAFSGDQYYNYLNQNLRLQVIKKMSEDKTLILTEEEQKQVYEENLEYFQNKDFEEVKASVMDFGLKEKFDLKMEAMLAKASIQIKNPEVIEKAVRKAVI